MVLKYKVLGVRHVSGDDNSNVVEQFLEEYFKNVIKIILIGTPKLYTEFLDWCEKKNFQSISVGDFKRKMIILGYKEKRSWVITQKNPEKI